MQQALPDTTLLDTLPRPGARTIVLDLLSTRARATLSAHDIIRAGGAFGIEATGMRTALARLKADGRLRVVSRGVYAPGIGAEPLQRRLRGWRTATARRSGWDGRWMIALVGGNERADRTRLRRTLRALQIGGFREAEPGLWVRPANLTSGVADMRDDLRATGGAETMLVARIGEVDATREALWRTLWDAAAIADAHRALTAELQRHATALDRAPVPQAAAATLILGREAIRDILRDPLLPDDLGGVAALDELVAAMIDYDAIGRAAWRAFWDAA